MFFFFFFDLEFDRFTHWMVHGHCYNFSVTIISISMQTKAQKTRLWILFENEKKKGICSVWWMWLNMWMHLMHLISFDLIYLCLVFFLFFVLNLLCSIACDAGSDSEEIKTLELSSLK